jgi:hypothetical protein
MHCDFVAFAQGCCLQLWEQSRAFGSALLSLFQRTVPDLVHSHSLAQRTVQVGGVENGGNSCIFSVLLQDFAALPKVYDSLLFSPLQKGLKESETRFSVRQAAQQRLFGCIQAIRSGQQVEVAEVRVLAEELRELGWEGHVSSAWRCFLHRVAPSLFTLPHFSVYELYETILHCLSEQAVSSPVIMLTGKQDSRPFSEFFTSHSSEMRSPTLWRVSLNTSPAALEERFEIGSWEFSLRLVHAYRNTPSGKHVIVYRKHEGEWICCNDAQITQAAPSSSDHIYTVVYESRPL